MVWPRFIIGSMRSDPAWNGRCNWLQIVGRSAMRSDNRLFQSLGWGDVNRTRINPSTCDTWSSSS